MTLFCGDLVTFLIGEKWRLAVELLQVTGLNPAFGHVAYNWDAYMRATDRTRPIASASAASMVTFLATGVPLLIMYGLRGLAVGIVVQTLANVVVRIYFLRQLFEDFSFLRQALRAVLPVIPAVAVVLVARLVETGPRTGLMALGELVAFGLIALAATWFFEGRLLREAVGYLGGSKATAPA